MSREIRANAQPLAVAPDGDARTISGYAAVFNSPANIGGIWTEVIVPGAFTEALRSGRDVLALYSHEIERLLGRQTAGTLRLVEDEKGLAVEIDLPDTTDGRDVFFLVQRGDLKGMSFGFVVTKQEWDETVSPPKRTIMAVDLYEVTVTADPAFEDTEIGLRSLEAVRRDRRSQNFTAASRRIADSQRRARAELKFRRIG